MKSGSNDVKGSAYYFGRDASLNAMSDRATQKHNDNPYWNAGATIGLPIKKNKLFLFAVFDAIENTQSAASNYTLPTALERQGDFSQSYNAERHAPRHLRPADLAHRQRRAGARPLPGQQDPREPLGPRGRADPGRPLGAQQRGRRRDRLQQLQVPGRADLPLPQLLDPPRLADQRPLEGLRARQPHEDGPGRERLHGRQRPAEAAQHHRVGSATAGTSPPTPSTPSTPRRRSTSAGPTTRSRTSASTPTWSSARRATRTCGRTAGGSRTPRAGRSSTRPTSSSRARRGTSSASRTSGTSSPRATASTRGSTSTSNQHSVKVGTEIRWKRGDAARFFYTDLRFVATATANRWTSPTSKTGHPWASFLLGAMDAGTSNVQYTAAADRQHRDVRLLRPGRLEGHLEAHAQPGAALRVPGRPVGPAVPAPAAARPHQPHPGDGRGDRPEDPGRHPGDDGPVRGRHRATPTTAPSPSPRRATRGRRTPGPAGSCRASASRGGSTRRPPSGPATGGSSPPPSSPTRSATPSARSTSPPSTRSRTPSRTSTASRSPSSPTRSRRA